MNPNEGHQPIYAFIIYPFRPQSAESPLHFAPYCCLSSAADSRTIWWDPCSPLMMMMVCRVEDRGRKQREDDDEQLKLDKMKSSKAGNSIVGVSFKCTSPWPTNS